MINGENTHWHMHTHIYSYNLLHKYLYISTHLQAAPSGVQPLQTLEDVGPPPLPGPGAEEAGPVDAGGADAALLPQSAGGPVQPALGQVMVDEAEDIGRFDGQGLLGRRVGGVGTCLAGAIVVGDHGGGPFFGHLRHGYWLKIMEQQTLTRRRGRRKDAFETHRRAFSSHSRLFPSDCSRNFDTTSTRCAKGRTEGVIVVGFLCRPCDATHNPGDEEDEGQQSAVGVPRAGASPGALGERHAR